jgi:hypothetical protein
MKNFSEFIDTENKGFLRTKHNLFCHNGPLSYKVLLQNVIDYLKIMLNDGIWEINNTDKIISETL